MKIKRIKSRAKRIASALQFTNLTDEQAHRLYLSFYESLRADWPSMYKQEPRFRLMAIQGGKK